MDATLISYLIGIYFLDERYVLSTEIVLELSIIQTE